MPKSNSYFILSAGGLYLVSFYISRRSFRPICEWASFPCDALTLRFDDASALVSLLSSLARLSHSRPSFQIVHVSDFTKEA